MPEPLDLGAVAARHHDLSQALWKGSENSDPTHADALAAHYDRAALLRVVLAQREVLALASEHMLWLEERDGWPGDAKGQDIRAKVRAALARAVEEAGG